MFKKMGEKFEGNWAPKISKRRLEENRDTDLKNTLIFCALC